MANCKSISINCCILYTHTWHMYTHTHIYIPKFMNIEIYSWAREKNSMIKSFSLIIKEKNTETNHFLRLSQINEFPWIYSSTIFSLPNIIMYLVLDEKNHSLWKIRFILLGEWELYLSNTKIGTIHICQLCRRVKIGTCLEKW